MDDWDKFNSEPGSRENQPAEKPKTYYYVNQPAPELRPGIPQEKPKKEKKKIQWSTKAFVLCLIICIIVSALTGAGAYMFMVSNFGGAIVDKSINTTNYNLAKATGSLLSVQEIIAKNENSVVAITTESVQTNNWWFGNYVTSGAGSGVVYSKDGYIVTNNHVIDNASAIKVTLYNGETYDAYLVATDPQSDVAVIKIEADNLIPVKFGSLDSASVGDLVIAIGNPLGKLSGTATEGIISALEREIDIEGKQMTLVQTSASVNPGNSGGGLFDQYGELIGLVVAKSGGEDVEGLGFAIPVEKVEKVAKSLIENGYVEGRPAAGIKIIDLTDANDAMQAGVSITGVYVSEVTGNNAKKAGLEVGDMIYYLDDMKVKSSAQLIAAIQEHEIGDEVTFTVVRENELVQCTLVLEDARKFAESKDDSKDKNKK